MKVQIATVMMVFSHLALAQMPTKMTKEKSNHLKTDKLVVYQIYTRLFGNLNTTNKFNGTLTENGTGKMNDINDKALKALKKFGVSHVWYTGVIEHATMTDYTAFGIKKDHPQVVKGIAGSPYSIKDYYDINPDLAVDVNKRMEEFEALVKRTHQNKLKVLIDFVPNHVARSYNSDVKPAGVEDFGSKDDINQAFSPKNNFYYLPGENFVVPAEVNPPVSFSEGYKEFPAKATGNDVFSARPSINDWFEAAKLNYGVDYQNQRSTHFEPIPDTWLKMRDILSYWTKKGVDGFRCDMAEMVPAEFWAWVIPEIQKVNPEILFIAEIYVPQNYKKYLFEGKFDYLYDKVGLYDAIRRLIEGGGDANDITKVWQNESGEFSNRMLRFLENHDEQRIASKFFANDPFKAIPGMALSATLHTGPVMIYFGQEVGVKPIVAEGFSGDDGRTTMFDYWGVPEFQAWVNQHQYDGGGLSEKQRQLREKYESILAFVNKNEAVKEGHFYDLQYFNAFGKSKNYQDKKIFSYLRFTDKQKLLFICNFDLENSYSTEVQIPEGAWQMMNWADKKNVSIQQKAIFSATEQTISAEKIKLISSEKFELTIKPMTMLVFDLK